MLSYRLNKAQNFSPLSFDADDIPDELNLEEQFYVISSIPNYHFWSWDHKLTVEVKFEQRLSTCLRYKPASPRNRIIQVFWFAIFHCQFQCLIQRFMNAKITIREFQEIDFPIYKAWFSNEDLKAIIGEVDEDWLYYVLNDKTGKEFVGYSSSGDLMAVLGVVYPTKQNNEYVITNIACNPDKKRQNIGTEMLQAVMKHLDPHTKNKWLAYINKENVSAQLFFDKNGWSQVIHEDKDLLKFVFSKSD